GAGAELDEPDRLEPPLLAEAEHARIEVERARLVAAANDDVVDLRDRERAVHARAQPTPAAASFASSARVRSTASPSPGTANCAFTRYSVPQWLTLPLRMSGPRTARYSFMWLYGFANESPSIPSITIWCERPMPSVKRPPAMACAESACCAIACGWRGKVGLTAVPSSMRRVSRAHSAAAMIVSMPMMLANQPLAKPSASARLALAMSPC